MRSAASIPATPPRAQIGRRARPRRRRVLAERRLALDELHRRFLARGDAPRRRAPNGNIDRRLTATHLPPLECLFAADPTCAAVKHRWRPRARIAISSFEEVF